MCHICGQPDFVRCNCQPPASFCEACPDNFTCNEWFDMKCIFYTSEPTCFLNLGFSKGASLEQILCKIDSLVGSSFNTPFIGVDTNTIHWSLSGIANHTVKADVKISSQPFNDILVFSDGIYFNGSTGDTYKVKIESNLAPKFLNDAIVGGTDGCVSISTDVDESGNLLQFLPSLDVECLVERIAADPTALHILTENILNEIINDPTFVSELSTAVENYILNDPTFITKLTQTIINTPSSQALFCQQVEACSSGGTSCVAPAITSANLVVNGGGGTVNLTVDFTPASPVPADGYILFYRITGTTPYSTFDTTTSPIVLNGLPAGDYEGYLISNCGGDSFSSGSTFSTSGEYFNVNTTNDLTGMVIQTVTGIPGYTLHGPVLVGNSDTGLHAGFTGAISMTLSGTAGINGNASLIINNVVFNCQNINSGTSPTVINFPSHTYVAGDQIQVTLNTGHC